MGAIVGVVLGGGASTRLGRPKQRLRLGERTLLGHAVANAEASALDRVVVVTGGDAPFVPGRAEVADNRGYDTGGCAASLLAGLDAAGDGCDAIVLLLGDMPGVDAGIVDHVVTAWRGNPTWAAVTAYDDGIGHPFVFSADAFGELRALHGDKAVWKIVDREPEAKVARIPIARSTPRDVDTWDDYVEVCASFGVTPEPR